MKVVYGLDEGMKLMKRSPLGDSGDWIGAGSEELDEASPLQVVQRILTEVRSRGDAAILEYTAALDGVRLDYLEVSGEEFEAAEAQVPADLRAAIDLAAERIRRFHQRQKRESWLDFSEGAVGMLIRPLDRVGLYAPGGKAAYPSTVLMTGVPAKVAGVPEVILATPPRKDGSLPPAVLYAARAASIDRVYKMGGAQAVAGMAFGTASVPKVDKICGPGNLFVTLAKKLLYGEVGIDGLEGPSEAIIVADGSASPSLCAADMMAQAEHDEMAVAFFVTTSKDLAREVVEEVGRLLTKLSRSDTIASSISAHGGIIVVDTEDESAELVNAYAPEHLSIMVKDPWGLLPKIRHAGAIFMGSFSSAALGDYVVGTNHILPTGGTARFASPLTVDDFTKSTSLVALNRDTALALGPFGARIAAAEGLTAHERAIQLRLNL
ncbi:MAG: histidinol dehydrogenase [Dehalococcoidia bacterium]|nr:histidinol dehydrogenase [Dehalococcoidia bacterium]